MLPGAPRAPLLHHVVASARLSLQLLGPEDFVDMGQAALGGENAVTGQAGGPGTGVQ